MRSRDNLAQITSFTGKSGNLPTLVNPVGKVFGVLLDDISLPDNLFNDCGGWDGLGTIFYMDYDQSKKIEEPDLNVCKRARPLFPQIKYFPVIGEIVQLIDLPSYQSQDGNTISQKYYINVVNIWNNPHHNVNSSKQNLPLGKTFKEKPVMNTVLPYEGDLIFESRFGSILRMSSSVTNTDPIIKLINNPNFDSKSLKPYIEDINQDGTSIYVGSSQVIPLKVDKTNLNSLSSTIAVDKYSDNQFLINSDRIVLNTKKDEILLFSKTNIELYTKQIISLNADERVHLNSPKIFLGTKSNKLPDEPLMLGNKTVTLLKDLLSELSKFCSSISTTVSTPAGTPLVDVNMAASKLRIKATSMIKKLDGLTSKQNYTA